MIRNATFVTLLVAAVLGIAVFALKYKVQDLEEQYTELNRAIIDNRQAMHVLRAEWSHLNEPQRLRELAERHLDLEPVATDQMGTFAALPAEWPQDEAQRPEAAPLAPRTGVAPPLHQVPPMAPPPAPPEAGPGEGEDDFARIISEALADRRSSR